MARIRTAAPARRFTPIFWHHRAVTGFARKIQDRMRTKLARNELQRKRIATGLAGAVTIQRHWRGWVDRMSARGTARCQHCAGNRLVPQSERARVP